MGSKIFWSLFPEPFASTSAVASVRARLTGGVAMASSVSDGFAGGWWESPVNFQKGKRFFLNISKYDGTFQCTFQP